MTNNVTSMCNNTAATAAGSPAPHPKIKPEGTSRRLHPPSLLWLKRRAGKYPKLIIFMAIVDILVSIFFLAYWALTVLMILLIFTTKVETAEETEIETEHLETLTIVIYILHPTFYSLSTITAIMLAQGIEKLEIQNGHYNTKKGCVCWILQSFFHCLYLEYILIFSVIKYDEHNGYGQDSLSIPLFCFHFLWKITAMLVIGSFLAFSLLLLWNWLRTSIYFVLVLRFSADFAHRAVSLFWNLFRLKYLGWALPLILSLLHCLLVLIFLQLARRGKKRPGTWKETKETPEEKRGMRLEALVCFTFLLGSLQWHSIRSGELLLMDFLSSILDILFRLFCLFLLLRYRRGSVIMADIETAP